MREIKFRAWDKENRVMKFVGLDSVAMVADEGHELMQYTGLLDKNGKEIYEGDYLLRHSPSLGYSKRFTVRWDNKRCCWDGLRSVDGVNLKTVEVIGNIYENPELVNDQQ